MTLSETLARMRRRLELGDIIILLYLTAFVRQYLWVVPSNTLAWVLTFLLSAAAWVWHMRTKEDVDESTPATFWPVAVLPLLFFFALRAALPDLTWDVLDYRIINAERAMRGWPMIEGDFFPTRFPFNPAPDVVMGLGRHLLGYRLGALINLSVLVWTGILLERMLRPYVRRDLLRSLAVLLVLLTEQPLFEINNYMVDLLALPLLLEATHLALFSDDDARRQRRAFVRIGLYLGAALAFKLTNLAFVVPILAVCVYRVASGQWRFNLTNALVGLAALLLPLLPYTVYIYAQTGSPVFPLFNRIFKSPYWPVLDPRTERWAPVVDDPSFKNMKVWEVLLWPLLLPFRVANTAGDLGPHWGRISLSFAASLAGVIWRGTDGRIRALSFVTLAGCLLWSAGSGMLRYAIFLELLGGAITVYFAAVLYQRAKEGARAPVLTTLKRAAAVLLVCILAAQSASSSLYAYRFEFGSRPNFFENPQAHLHELRFLLRDRSCCDHYSAQERALFEDLGVWVQSSPMTSGLQVMMKPDVPEWCVYMTEFFETEEARDKFRRVLDEARGKKIYTLALTDQFVFATENIRRAGFGVGRMTSLTLPYYSDRARFHTVSLIELLPPGEGQTREFTVTSAGGPLPAGAFKASISWSEPPPSRLRAGEQRTLRVVLRNEGDAVWPALGKNGGNYRILVGNHWAMRDGRVVVNDDGRSPLLYDLQPGEEVELPLTLTAPPSPGEYILEIDVLQEGVSWFGLKGSKILKSDVTVER